MVALLERGAWGAAIAYALCSVGLSLLGTFAGRAAFRALA
jgi:fluoride ion exporter CrcB/FEX